MEHGGEAARPRPTTVGSDELGMASAVRGSEAVNVGGGAFDDAQLGAAAAAPGSFSGLGLSGAPTNNSTGLVRQVRTAAGRGEVLVAVSGPGPDVGEFWRQRVPVDAALPGLRLHDVVVLLVLDNDGYSALQLRPGARRGVVLPALLSGGGAVYNGDYALQPRRDAGHGEVFVGLLPTGGVDAVYRNSAEFARHVRTDDAGRGEVPVAVFHREPGPGVAYPNVDGFWFWQQPGRVRVVSASLRHPDVVVPALQPRPGAGRGELFLGPLPDGVGAVYGNRGMLGEHLRRLLPFAGIGASSVAINGLAAGPGSPAVAFHLFVLLLGGLLLIILHLLRA